MKTRLFLTILRDWGELRSQSHLTHRKGGEVEFGAEKDESETSVGRLRHQILMWIRSWKGSFPTAAPFSPAPGPRPPSRKRAAAAGAAAAAKRWGAVGKSVGGARDGRRTEWKNRRADGRRSTAGSHQQSSEDVYAKKSLDYFLKRWTSTSQKTRSDAHNKKIRPLVESEGTRHMIDIFLMR